MPGNEVGDRVHNFFQQGNLSQNQHQTQAVEANWTVFNNKPWGANNRQNAGLFGSKNYNTLQADSDRGEGNQFPLGPYVLNSAQSNPTAEFSKSQSQNQSPSLNGFIHTPQVSRTRNNEEHAMEFDTQSDRCYPISRGLSTVDSQQRSGLQHNNPNSMYFGTIESPVNFDFIGNQQQMSSQQLGPLQSLPGQQSGINDIQQMQQQFMLKQMQELQRQHQLQQLEALHRNSLHQIPNISNQTVNNPPALINETSIHDGRSIPWSSQVILGNPNWLQCVSSAAVQGFSNGIMVTPEQGQALQFNSLVPQQVSQSLYGVPVNSTWAAAPFFHGQIDKPGMQHVLAYHSSHSANQHALFPEQTSSSIQGGATELKPGFANKSSFQSGFGPGSGEADHVEYFTQTQQRNALVQESRGMLGLTGSSELSDRTANRVASSKSAVALDPTEEKILYGSDDNIWEAFGGSLATVTDSSDHLDGAFPSMQSGSWSALMQSAVAECSSSTVTQQGAWGGVGIQNSGSVAANQHSSISHDSEKHLAAWVDDSQAASLSSKSIVNDASASNNFGSAVLPPFLNEPRVSLEALSAHQSSREGRNWLGNSRSQALAEARQVKNVYSSAELHSKGPAGCWSHEQNLPLQGNESIHRTNAFRIIESSTENGVTTSKAMDSLGHDRGVSINVGHAGSLSNRNSAPNQNIGFLEPMFNSKDEAVIRSSSSVKVNEESREKLLENHNLNFWGRPGSMKSGTDELKYHQQVGQSPQVLDSSLNSSVRGRSEMFETGNVDRRENSSDSRSSNISHHALPGSFRQKSGSDIGKNSFPRERQTLSVPGGIKNSGPRKFQHHPMGDMYMDEELVYGKKHPLQSEVISHPIIGGIRSQEQQSMFLHPATVNSSASVKGLASNIRGNATASSDHPSSTSHSDYMFGASASDKPMPSSQNMLELLHKVDQSNDQNGVRQLSSSVSTGAAERESSDGTVRQLKQSSASHSQSFGLQLAPPSQGLLASYSMVAGQNSSEKVNFASMNAVPSGAEDKANAWMSLSADVQNLPPLQQTSKVGTFTPLAHGFGDTKSRLQIQHKADAGGKIIDNERRQLADLPLTCTFGSTVPNELKSQREVSQLTSLEQQDVNLSMRGPAISASNMTQQKLLGVQSVHVPNLFMPQQPGRCTEPHPSTQQEKDYEGALGRQTTVTSCAIIRGKENPGREVDAAVKVDDSLSKSGATQKEIEAFGRSLRPNNHVPENSSIMRHMQAGNASEIAHGDRQLKRLKRSDNSPDADYNVGQMFSGGLNCVVRNASASSELVLPGDAMMTNISPEANNNQDNGTPSQVQTVNISLQDKICDGEHHSGADREPIVGHSQISPRGTWFDQEVALKNAESSQTFSSLQQQFMSSDSKNFVKDHPLGRVNAAIDAGHIGDSQHPITTSVMGNQSCFPHPLVPSVIAPTVETPRLKKWKSATSALLPWHEEVALCSQGVQTTSSAEVQWAQAANRLVEKHEDETDINGDMLLVNRLRRRLILTTQLMQQLLSPPSAAILSLDASSNYETVAYFVARLVLGDACGMACSLASDSYLGNENSLSVKRVTSGRTHDRYFSKLVEDFTDRARKLEDMLRLDKQALTLDLRLECQDLDRLSVINRFAMFHGGRAQADVVETSSSSNTAAVMQKPIPQRYVMAHAVPLNLPDGVQCLSL